MTEPKHTPFLPLWMWGVVAIETTIPLFFGIASVFDPSIWGAESLGALGQLYVVRNITMALGVLAAALLLRSYVALLITVAIRYATDFVDITAAILRGAHGAELVGLAIFTIVLLVIPAFGLRWLWHKKDTQTPAKT